MKKKFKLGILGLGYVGLPVFLSFSKKYETVGYDIDINKISYLKKKYSSRIKNKSKFVNDIEKLKQCNVYIVIVPTPVDQHNIPDLNLLKNACHSLGKILTKFDVVIFESTVYPGVTEDICGKILSRTSKLKIINDNNRDKIKNGFYIGYSPERINPGDTSKEFEKINKIISCSSNKISKDMASLYQSVLKSKVHIVESIKVAESAKIIENIQRDVNIALINELAMLFNKLDLNTENILKAAETKWNFASFRPGLVGGHCIGVDPYYLTYKANEIGFDTEIITKGRKINNYMPKYIASQFLKIFKKKKIYKLKPNILILGFTFKEDFDDIRNTKVYDLYKELIDFGCKVDIYDPLVSKINCKKEYDIDIINKPLNNFYDGIIIAVKHKIFKKIGISKIKKWSKPKSVIYDLKYLFDNNQVDSRL